MQLKLFIAQLTRNLLAKSKPLISLHLLVLLKRGFIKVFPNRTYSLYLQIKSCHLQLI